MVNDHGAAGRLIESAFPLRETSIDSVHENNVRHGHISTLHVWPAGRSRPVARRCWRPCSTTPAATGRVETCCDASVAT